MLHTFEHVIWDWNGTLLDDVALSVEIINEMLDERDLPQIVREVYQQLFEFPVEAYYRRLGFDFDEEPFAILASQYIETYNRRVRECELHVGVLDILSGIARQGIPQSVLSSHKHSFLVQELQQHRLFDRFESVQGIDNHYAAGKLEVGRAMLDRLAIDPSRSVLIGDTIHDLEVARELGVSCILISNGHYARIRLDSAHDWVLDSLQELEIEAADTMELRW